MNTYYNSKYDRLFSHVNINVNKGIKFNMILELGGVRSQGAHFDHARITRRETDGPTLAAVQPLRNYIKNEKSFCINDSIQVKE